MKRGATADLNRQLEAYAAVAKLPQHDARRRWANWAIYAAATGAALASASAASAEIIYSGPIHLTSGGGNSRFGYSGGVGVSTTRHKFSFGIRFFDHFYPPFIGSPPSSSVNS